jgi:hypothetical protein
MKIKSTNVIPQWADNYPEVKRWLAKLQDKTGNAWGLYRFCQWCSKSPPELLKMETANKDVEKLLDEFVAADVKDFTNATKFHAVTATKSFFRHNYTDLAKASGSITLEKMKPYNMPTKEGLRKLWSWALNPRDKALISFVSSTAIAKETLSRLQWKHLETDWETVELPCVSVPAELLKGHGVGRYKGVQQITFLTGEAKRDLQTYKQWIEKRLGRKLTADDHIFLAAQKPYEPLAYGHMGKLIWDLSREAGVPFSWHDARRYVNTAMEQIQMSPNWARKIRGRKVRGEEAPYSRPAVEQLREKFREAVPLLEFTSEKPTVTKETLREEITKALEEEKLKAIADKYHVTLEEVKTAMRSKTKGWEKLLQKRKDCSNGSHCQRIVSEDELTKLLAGGWRFVATLPSGKCVVSNET